MSFTGVCVGLGNPGPEYAHTRHNSGFDVLDLLLEDAIKVGRCHELCGTKFSGQLWQVEGNILTGNWLCIKPQTFMNLSGRCVQATLSFYKLTPKHLVVIHDELDLPAGELRFKFSGGDAGHNGLKSISQCLGTNDYYRLRIGIGKPEHKSAMLSWVLGKAEGEDATKLALSHKKALEVLNCFSKNGVEEATALAKRL